MGKTQRLRQEISTYLSTVGEANTSDYLDHVNNDSVGVQP